MASSITTSASFTTGNMKPASGEQLDALWGQNSADNGGYVYYRRAQGPSWSSCLSSGLTMEGVGTQYFNKRTEYPYLYGSYNLRGTASASDGPFHQWGTILVNGANTVRIGGTVSPGGASLTSGSFVVDISALTNDTDYTIVFKHSHDEGDSVSAVNSIWSVSTWFCAT